MSGWWSGQDWTSAWLQEPPGPEGVRLKHYLGQVFVFDIGFQCNIVNLIQVDMAGLIKLKWDNMHDEHLEQEQMPHVPTIRNLLQD